MFYMCTFLFLTEMLEVVTRNIGCVMGKFGFREYQYLPVFIMSLQMDTQQAQEYILCGVSC